jgi:hypothetical protein
MTEFAIEGWEAIAEMFRVDIRTMQRRREELQQAGAIFYVLKGQPKRRIVCAFPSVLKAWIAIKSSKGEML